MTNEERDIITQFVARVSGARPPDQTAFTGSVPATTSPPLPPVDPEADRLIAEQFSRYPEARYRLTQLAFVQEHALVEAQNRIQRMEWELQQARQAAQQAQQQQGAGSGGGFFSGLFGGGSRSAPPPPPQGGPGPAWNQGPAGPAPNYQQAPPPPPQYGPSYQPGMFQRPGSGFLGSALTTAAGVAGGIVAGNALMNLFSGSHGGGFGGGTPMTPSPWGSAPTGPDQGYIDQGTWSDPASGSGTTDPGYVDSGTWDTSGDNTSGGDQSSWTDNSGGTDSGWDTGGGSSDDDTF
jgi:hypothetical protein